MKIKFAWHGNKKGQLKENFTTRQSITHLEEYLLLYNVCCGFGEKCIMKVMAS